MTTDVVAMASPPSSPPPARPRSGLFQMGRSASRMSVSGKPGGGSRASDEDGKTSVKVAVRVRPPLQPSDPGFELIPQRYQRSMVHTSTPTGLTVESPQGKKFFIFDKVFGEDTKQEGVWEYVKDGVDSFLQGYNVSILAYGQSGSGKSYTMGTSAGGEQNDHLQMGVIPRAATSIFHRLHGPPGLTRSGSSGSGLRTPTRYSMHGTQGLANLAKQHSDKNWQMKVTYVEIYNEQLRDLLLPEDIPPSERPAVAIREDTKGRILLTGLRAVTIESVDDLLRVLNFGSSIRQTDSTAINAISSRSHAVFSVNLLQKKSGAQPAQVNKRFSVPIEALTGGEDFVTTDSKLHFVDLAGSERLKNTGASGDRAREGISINAGLASLGKVISQLSSRHPGTHISYRDSRLTRLLQDSLGGNAITYMVACVTPAEFHLSETLNTVQYAQRARAIQSKPQLQQVNDDSDKQAAIERLRAEVSFLRQQIRSSEGGPGAPHDRFDRQNDREMELQNQLLDVQENYNSLGQRHAKLISEIAKARNEGENADTPTLNEDVGESAKERLKRSNSFAEAVEKMVLEYEKTIQSLEGSLTNTRSTLSSTESSLLERENKCAMIDSINQQLQNRIQKYQDRESTTDEYLKNLEQKLDSQTSGDAKSTAMVAELRKEIARVRENEAQCEDYISTLEERLAEADQDLEMKQRELDRLEHVVERQRSIGKLDSLLHEFDHMQQNGQLPNNHSGKSMPNGVPKAGHSHKRTLSTLEEAARTTIPESDEEDESQLPNGLGHHSRESGDADTPKAISRQPVHPQEDHESPAQKRAIDDQFENVTQQLFDLQITHGETLQQLEKTQLMYDEALRTLAQVQDAADEARHARDSTVSPISTRPTSFLEDARVTELKEGGQETSSRSLSSELSLAGDSATSLEPSVDESPHKKRPSGDSYKGSQRDDSLLRELDEIKRSSYEKDQEIASIRGSFSELEKLHVDTLDMLEDLRTENVKLKATIPQPPSSPVIRRKSSQNVMTIDRAHRSLASLKNLAADNFESNEDMMQNFELNLNTLMHELHQRSERVQLLEHEVSTVKKEMDSKNSMISGLTRERSSIKASSPIMDMSVMSTMNDQLVQREQQMRELQETYAIREQELEGEVASLRDALDRAQVAKSNIPGFFPETPATSTEANKQLGDATVSEDTTRLQNEVAEWQRKHQASVDSMQASEQRLLSTISELEASLTAVDRMRNEAEDKVKQSESRSASENSDNDGRKHHFKTIESLRKELESQKTLTTTYISKNAKLSELQEKSRTQAEDAMRFRKQSEKDIESHRAHVAELKKQVEQDQGTITFHKHGLKSLHDKISELEGVIESQQSSKGDMERNMRDMEAAHNGHLARLESDVVDLKAQLEKAESQLQSSKSQLDSSRTDLRDELEQAKATCNHLERQRDELQRQAQSLKSDIAESGRTNKHRIEEMEKLRAEKERAANLVEELEDQLSNSYDQQQASTSRLSQLHNTHDSQLKAVQEANQAVSALQKQLENSQNQVEQLQSQLRETQQTSSNRDSSQPNNNASVRKSASVTSLPSPPPAIPLPPLPAGAVASPTSTSFPASATSPPPPPQQQQPHPDLTNLQSSITEKEAHIRTMEKHLFAEKQLTATLEEALMDLETQGKKTKSDMEAYKKKCWALEDEVGQMKREGKRVRDSMRDVEEEQRKRVEAERAREKLEERMRVLAEDGKGRKKKKGGFNCF